MTSGETGAAAAAPASGAAASTAPAPSRRVLGTEVLLVLGVSIGASAIFATYRIVERLSRPEALSQQTAALNVSRLPDRPWFDLVDQLLRISLALVPVLLAVYLLSRYPGDGRRLIGLDWRRPRFDLGSGALLAMVIGIPGLALYVAALHLGIGVRIAPAALSAVWWAVPVLILAALQNALLEEVIGVGYLLTRLRELGWHAAAAVGAHALLRGSYHLYQGFGGFIGNAIMGVIFALFYLRYRRVMPLVIAHTILDVVAFVGYGLYSDELDSLLGRILGALG
ncbi:CPBP family intramembrane metalloprotease [Natronosporangium hydrolyticum]|uniref:CPBP family intramembrane metalloprotease n=1 Tax=Natronosporangium hydrolyticum TaxID=2811111 RepID=A0A895Y9K8_9ACTN|nr:CPBP family intramembrane glutamic endopeptidase [Natronosporangium hydrolyticum]QSB14427.1 CPBP family intramembrane metalloprotease [Natronosporangium hydrolyticum]